MNDPTTCQACPLWECPSDAKAHLAVPGEGPAPARVMLVGEAPGKEEARTGRPFVGPSGRRLDQLLKLAGLERDTCYFTNLLKHRPPRNRNPHVGEIKAVKPQYIITLGGFAARFFHKHTSLTRDHGVPRQMDGFILVPMYHPAAGLRDPEIWATLVQDFMVLKDILAGAQQDTLVTDYRLANEETALTTALSVDLVGFDLETTSPRRGKKKVFMMQEAQIVGYSVSSSANSAVYVPGNLRIFAQAAEYAGLVKVCHQAKFEYGRLAQLGITLTNFHDTKLAAWLLQYHSTHLKSLTRQHLGRDPITYEQVTQGRDMSELDEEEIVDYAAADADNTRQLWPRMELELHQAGLWELYTRVELPLIPILHEMENRGVLVDEALAQHVVDDLDIHIGLTEVEVTLLGLPAEFRVSATNQLAAGLEKMDAPITERTEAYRQLKTDEDTLLEVAKTWRPELMGAILAYKSLVKSRGFANQYLELRGPDGRLHPDWVQTGAGEEVSDKTSNAPVTGRLSCRGPNLQQQPHRKGWADRLRRCIIPTPGWLFVAGDISQEEVRIAAYVTGERRMLADMEAGIPVYQRFGEGIFGHLIDKASEPDLWNVAKQSVLSFIWGSAGSRAWAPRLQELVAEQSGVTLSLKEATEAYGRLEELYPDIPIWRRSVWEFLVEHGYVRDYYSRRRWLPGIYQQDKQSKMAAWREGMNFLIQGPGGSIIKIAMQNVMREIDALQSALLLSEHDGLTCECPPEEVDTVARALIDSTRGIFPIELPVEIQVGANWGEMKPWT